ncbi:hypothetical protein [Pseudodesulfovibrio senegalensis]|uniref:hypothetical protein n=1 Tax=Pseudodesulfovibrio senegalensis TaxID=1721087 RepID=UPI001478C501|nr:hypothetical protein [Pseudodesulfovibrio senegalensis]
MKIINSLVLCLKKASVARLRGVGFRKRINWFLEKKRCIAYYLWEHCNDLSIGDYLCGMHWRASAFLLFALLGVSAPGQGPKPMMRAWNGA